MRYTNICIKAEKSFFFIKSMKQSEEMNLDTPATHIRLENNANTIIIFIKNHFSGIYISYKFIIFY
jgi:hypothetical protein